VYYRYKPRRVASLCEDTENGVVIADPKIHEAVFERIAANTTGYAPAGLPDHYRVVDERGRVSDPNPTTYETAEQRRSRLDLLDRARDHIFWRQVLYYMLVFVTLALVFMPYYWPPIPGAEPDDWLQTVLSKALDWLPALLPGFLGSWVGYWADTWTQSALSFSALAVVYVLLLWHSRTVTTNTLRLSELAWWHVKHVNEPDEAKPASPPVGPFERLANRLRNWKRLETFHRLSIKKAVPVLAIVFGLYVVSGAAYRVAFHFPSVGDGVCRQWLGAGETDDSEGLRRWQRGSRTVAIPFDTNIPCFDTGLNLRAGQRYVIELTDEKDWQDGGYAASSSGLSGLTHLVHPVFVAGVPTRRHVLLPWFTLIAEIGADSGYVLPINRNKVVIRPRQGGRLYLYVNDAINGLGSELGFDPDAINGFPIDEVERQNRRSSAWYAYYLNNAGSATLRVTRNP
jgi:hypothetical protein